MSSITSYKTTAFKESQKFLVVDPATQSPSLVLGSDLVSYITPMLNYVRADSTRLSAENTDYDVGTLVQTSGATSPGDNFAATYLVVEGGSGDFPMLNGNDLLVIKGDEFLREQLISQDAGEGASLVSMEGGPTVQAAVTQNAADILERTIYKNTVAEIEALSLDPGVNVYLTEEGRAGEFVVISGDFSTELAADTYNAFYIGLADDPTALTKVAKRRSSEVWIDYFGVLYGDTPANASFNNPRIQAAINYCANNRLNRLLASSGVVPFEKLYFTYDPVNNPNFPSSVREGWGLVLEGKGRLYSEPTSVIETEIAATLGTVFRSTETTAIPVNALVDSPSTTQQGVKFKSIAFVGDTSNWLFESSATPNSDLFESVSFHNKNNAGSGVKAQDVWISSWRDVLISCPDYTGAQTGTALIARNTLFAGGGMWNWENINVRGGKYSGQIGYMTDPGQTVQLLDSLNLNVIQCRNAQHGLQIGGKVRSAFIAGYHTEGCTETGGRIAAEAGSVLMVAPYFDCALCTDASLVLGNSAGVAGANLDERTWSEVELRAFNFIDTNNVGIKVDDGAFGQNLVLATGKIGKVSGAGTLGIDFDSFDGAVRVSNVRYTGLSTNFSGLNPDQYVDDGNFVKHNSTLLAYDKKEIVVETLSANKFLSILSPEKQIITPTASFDRVVLPNVASGREFFFHNSDGSLNLNLRDSTNTTTLYSVPAGESISVISDGSNWIFY